jgi:hypothetical protein
MNLHLYEREYNVYKILCQYVLVPPRMAAHLVFQKFSGFISHNVPAVCDVFAARIRALRSKDQGCKNVGGMSRGRRSRLGEWNPGGPKARNAYRPVRRSLSVLYILNFSSDYSSPCKIILTYFQYFYISIPM